MPDKLRVGTAPPKPLMIYDGDCGFCRRWIRRWQQMTGDTVDYLPSQDPSITARFPEISGDRFDTAVLLVLPDGTVSSGAEAVFRALAQNPDRQWVLNAYYSWPRFAKISEWGYSLVASHRGAFSLLTRWGWGAHVEQPTYHLVRWLFLRGMGVVYLVAFTSLWSQIDGLIGHDGILPTDQFMSGAARFGDENGVGLDRYRQWPTLCWFNASDASLHFQCAAGTVLAVLLISGIAPVPCLAFLWLLYLSLVTVGQDFYAFQWDNLLLETGMLAIFFAPMQWLPRWSREGRPSRTVLWLLRLLLFKLYFLSGCVKLLNGDPNWRNLTALTYHYQTQPLPPWTAWYANQLPLWFQKLSCAGTFFVEIGLPFLIFAPRRVRMLGCAGMVGLQVLILATGNYTFFNWLALALCLLLLDDFALSRCLPARWRERMAFGHQTNAVNWRVRGMRIGLVFLTLPISIFLICATVGWRPAILAPMAFIESELSPLRSVNSYGLFAVMTTKRNEIILEGSDDGVIWLPYEFKYKPGDIMHRPAFIAPLQPRLDWQMWFAALGDARSNPWLLAFCQRLLQGSPPVLGLLAKNPFPDHPPRYLRAEFYEYHFTNYAERRQNGAWWKREPVGEYLPPLILQNGVELKLAFPSQP